MIVAALDVQLVATGHTPLLLALAPLTPSAVPVEHAPPIRSKRRLVLLTRTVHARHAGPAALGLTCLNLVVEPAMLFALLVRNAERISILSQNAELTRIQSAKTAQLAKLPNTKLARAR